MQSENFDKNIKSSLSQRPPGNDDPAWDKMEVLLDKHLPHDKKDHRRVFLFLFLFLLTSGGAFLIWQNNSGNKNNISTIESQNKKPGQTENNKIPGVNSTNNTAEKESLTEEPAINDQSGSLPGNNNTENKTSINKNVVDNRHTITNASSNDPNSIDPGKNLVDAEDHVKTETSPVSIEKNELIKEQVMQKAINENKVTDSRVPQPIPAEKANPEKQKNKKSFFNNLFFTASAGPDFSTVGIDNAGDVQLTWGAGIGYQISNKFSIRTGFYSARKVYSADPDNYHPPYNFWQYYPNLESIDANCKVYEIPVTVDYTISKKENHSWFVSAGVSSLLMKKETYEYYFKPNNSPTYITHTRTISDQNKHYFSVLNLSGGYTRTLNKNISLRAEPYVKIAMNGVGYGNVNLNSGGILFSAIIRPFASTDEK